MSDPHAARARFRRWGFVDAVDPSAAAADLARLADEMRAFFEREARRRRTGARAKNS